MVHTAAPQFSHHNHQAHDESEYEDDEDELEDSDCDSDFDPDEFKIRHRLKSPHERKYTMEELHERIHDGIIELTPAWQRDVVWTDSKQAKLIDSIFHGYPIPPVVLAIVDADDSGQESFVCVDGKQRLTSIQKFMDGQLCYTDPVTRRKWWYNGSRQSREKKFIPADGKREFAKRTITCVEFCDLSSSEVREMFQRVQLGVALNGAEKLQAISSPYTEWISNVVTKHVSVDGGLYELLDWDTARAKDFLGVAQIVFCCEDISARKKSLVSTGMEKWLSRPDKPTPQVKAQIDDVMRIFTLLANPEDGHNKAFKNIPQRVAPAEFVFIGVLIFRLAEENVEDDDTMIEQMAEAAWRLRVKIRELFRDVRMNTDVVSGLWKIADTLVEDPYANLDHITLASLGRSKKRVRSRADGSTSRKKPKRGEDDEDDDYKPARQTNGRH